MHFLNDLRMMAFLSSARSHDIPLTAASEYEDRRLSNAHLRELLRRFGFLLPTQSDRFCPMFPLAKTESVEELMISLKSLGSLPDDIKFPLHMLEMLASHKGQGEAEE